MYKVDHILLYEEYNENDDDDENNGTSTKKLSHYWQELTYKSVNFYLWLMLINFKEYVPCINQL